MSLLLLGIGLIVAGGVAALVVARGRVGGWVFATLIVAGCVLAATPAFGVLIGHVIIPEARWTPSLPGGDWVIGIDGLSAVFVVAITAIGATNAVFGDAYMRAGAHPRVVQQANAIYALLLATMLVVVTAQSTLLFLCAWEAMAITSFLLIITENEDPQVRRAGLLYIISTHAATLLLFVMFALLSHGLSDWSFASLDAASQRTPWIVAPVLSLALLGFGVKAGYVPLHFWLPPAHAASPSHVSALMSGVVIKTGIYGILRVLMLVGPPPFWWAWIVLALGATSALLGVLWALAQHDIKRLLAYHSVENIGIILLGVGIGALGTVYGHPLLAMLGYAAALLHVLNHALFKSLLFMAAGSLYRRTGTRNIEQLGGLGKGMPVTFVMFLIGSVAIIGVPPLNGFVSELLVYQGLFRAGQQPGVMRLAILGAPILGLVGGLALACFAKAAGVIFLGRARSDQATGHTEVGLQYLVPQGALAAVCVLIGLWPASVVVPMMRVGAAVARQSVPEPASLAVMASGASRVAIFAATLTGVIILVAVGRYFLMRRRPVRADATWGCGYDAVTPRMQYTASSFAQPLLSVFGSLSGVEEHRGATVFHSEPHDLVLDRGLTSTSRTIQSAALRLRPMQQGRLHLYLLYMVAGVVACLAYLVLAP
jgi:formate hydrogenlyase subunit 3/multisubunit Na+/H+ antiporter MnhD subunit